VEGGQRERLLLSGLFIRAKSELIEGIHAAGVHFLNIYPLSSTSFLLLLL
jgi:hypothetical protein